MGGDSGRSSADDSSSPQTRLERQENAWFRQVLGYWDMASSLVSTARSIEDLFLRTSFSGEMWFIFAKVQPFLKEVREKMQDSAGFFATSRT